MTSKFKVGDAVMFFISDGKLMDPPCMDEVTSQMLYSAPCGTVISVNNNQITVRLDDGISATISENDLKKIWFLNGPTQPVSQKRRLNSGFLPGFGLPRDLEKIRNIRPIGDA